MRVIKYPLFYVIGMSLFLMLNFRWRYVFRLLFFRPKVVKVCPNPVPDVFKEGKTVPVSIVQGYDIYAILCESIAMLGGLEKLNVKGKSILIKPNIVNRYPSPSNTNPLVIKYLIKILLESGVSKVFVGDMSAIFSLPTKKNAFKSGIWDTLSNEDHEFVPFEDYRWVEVSIPRGRFLKKALVSEFIYTVDRVINVPVIKTHSYAHYSISLKNFMGAVHPRQRPFFIEPAFWDEIVAELNLAYTPHLNILDGTRIFTKGGPTKGTVAVPNLIIATSDRIAADVTGLSVIKSFGGLQNNGNQGVWEQRQVKRAIELKLGIEKPSELKIMSKCLGTNESLFNELIQKIHYHLNVT
ncbi:MAG: DUF362 domain-containing protein [Candidatus Loosdrechtia sp.]|uniref:DUF362 domain-containing protein n=1 Tax=Candidatus Loosdrechtia sp. TaxID=3101272 RepID=UPI003A798A73|nr:MAG: DUF362 domain-containing protein [Candidatus Jettenia sp. AMX2]